MYNVLAACLLACQVCTEALKFTRVNRAFSSKSITCNSLNSLKPCVHLLDKTCVVAAAINARHQAEKRKLQQAMAPDNVPPARTSTPGIHPSSAYASITLRMIRRIILIPGVVRVTGS